MRVLGVQRYAHIAREKRKRLDDSGMKGYFLGYEKNTNAYRLLNTGNNSIESVEECNVRGTSTLKDTNKTDGQVIDVISNDERLMRMTWRLRRIQ